MLVEDDIVTRQLLSKILCTLGHRPITLKHGREALEAMWNRVEFDLIISDLRMPEMDGYELISYLRDDGCALPIIAITADQDHGPVNGADQVLHKPIFLNKIRAAIAEVCDARS